MHVRDPTLREKKEFPVKIILIAEEKNVTEANKRQVIGI